MSFRSSSLSSVPYPSPDILTNTHAKFILILKVLRWWISDLSSTASSRLTASSQLLDGLPWNVDNTICAPIKGRRFEKDGILCFDIIDLHFPLCMALWENYLHQQNRWKSPPEYTEFSHFPVWILLFIFCWYCVCNQVFILTGSGIWTASSWRHQSCMPVILMGMALYTEPGSLCPSSWSFLTPLYMYVMDLTLNITPGDIYMFIHIISQKIASMTAIVFIFHSNNV